MEIIKNFFKWLYSCRYLNDFNKSKNLLIYTNIAFFIVTFLSLKYCKKNIKDMISIFLIFTMGIVSTIYHYNQCHSGKKTQVQKWINLDVSLAILTCFIILPLYYKNINLKICILVLICLILFFVPSTNNIYVYCHSLWHIMVGVTFYFLVINNNSSNL